MYDDETKARRTRRRQDAPLIIAGIAAATLAILTAFAWGSIYTDARDADGVEPVTFGSGAAIGFAILVGIAAVAAFFSCLIIWDGRSRAAAECQHLEQVIRGAVAVCFREGDDAAREFLGDAQRLVDGQATGSVRPLRASRG
ncbi:hypothetical protein ABZ671_01665 [Micromonospora sp. NPDC006766]|uniref:hypothetical protein n=1 Tax=Micromonospora sp. NPDC006766 TaxID=3154778 RepID=UPI003400B6CA